MITRTRVDSPREAALRLPAFAIALSTAEIWFRFGSFALECLAFLAVWGALDILTTLAISRWQRSETASTPR